ncbi:hypothetical protein CASFOL_027048 [Castilleja foliolosa]|uniref:Interferon-related developmental regulator N-terminal domain-containing protein n=1 Tax=Castilleja foliolosa TaxID=1961234 RepID=A0ABD3CIU2_9LAMI
MTVILEHLLCDLSSTRNYVRKRALSLMAEYLRTRYSPKFAQENFATILYGCLSSCKRGDSHEIGLGSRTLGLLAITIGYSYHAEELVRETFSILSDALKKVSTDIAAQKSVLLCLAICSFSCANFSERESSMKLIWQVVLSKPNPEVLAAAIESWAFLLTCAIDVGHRRNSWTRVPMLYLMLLSGGDDHTIVSAAADDAVALVMESELEGRGRGRGRIHEILPVGEHKIDLFSFSKVYQSGYIVDFLEHGALAHLLENKFLHENFGFCPPDDDDDKDVDRAESIEEGLCANWTCFEEIGSYKEGEEPADEPKTCSEKWFH